MTKPLFESKNIRKHLQEAIDSFLIKKRKGVISLNDFDGYAELFDQFRDYSSTTILDKFGDIRGMCYLFVISVGVQSVSISIKDNEEIYLFPKNWIAEFESKRLDFKLMMSLLLQLSNYSLSVVRLVESGLDNPARAILRIVNELSLQIIMLLFDRSDFEKYASPVDGKEKEIWYELFTRKQRMYKRTKAHRRSSWF